MREKREEGGLLEFALFSCKSRPTVYNYFELFERTCLIRRVPVASRSSDREIVKAPKLHFADNGILNTIAEPGSGIQFENSVFNQLRRSGGVRYYSRKSGRKIDSVVDGRWAFEAKEMPGLFDLKSLKDLASNLSISRFCVVFRHAPESVHRNFVWGGDLR